MQLNLLNFDFKFYVLILFVLGTINLTVTSDIFCQGRDKGQDKAKQKMEKETGKKINTDVK